MTYDEVAEVLKFTPDVKEAFSGRWAESMESYPEKGVFFLEDDFVRKYLPRIEYKKEDLLPGMLRTAKLARENPVLSRFIWHVYHRMFKDPIGGCGYPVYAVPEEMVEGNAGLFGLLSGLACIPLIDKKYAEMGIPGEKFNQPAWIGGTIDNYRKSHDGKPGFYFAQLGWLTCAAVGILFRVGRFEFKFEQSYTTEFPVILRNNESGKMICLAQDGWEYDKDWIRRFPKSPETVHKVRFLDAGDFYEGIHLRCDTTIDPVPIRLKKSEWSAIQKPWNLAISMHIPGGGGMTPELAETSLKAAVAFFRDYLHRDVPVITLSSWILNPAWRERMPESNLAKFQKSVFCLRIPEQDGFRHGMSFIFGRGDGDPLKDGYPQNTTLQRVALDVFREKGRLVSGGGVIPAEFLSKGFFGKPEEFFI